MASLRLDGRAPDEPRPMHIQRHWLPNQPGSVLIDCGLTRVLCTAVVEDGVPPFLKHSDMGWVTAEYAMQPASTGNRKPRERGRTDGRSVEIQRLIGRALRAIVDRRAIPGRTVWIDCDVLAADGGTRTTALNGAYVALHDALAPLKERGDIKRWPLKDSLQAVSIGIVEGEPRVDLSYYEDSSADVDLNLIMTGKGEVIEMGGGAEQGTFTLEQLATMAEMGKGALERIRAVQNQALQS